MAIPVVEFQVRGYKSKKCLSSPSACRRSGASNNWDWPNGKMGTIDLCNFGVTWCYLFLLKAKSFKGSFDIPYVRHHNPLLITNRSWILAMKNHAIKNYICTLNQFSKAGHKSFTVLLYNILWAKTMLRPHRLTSQELHIVLKKLICKY